MNRERLWISPVNDAEACEIARLLAERGEPVLVTKQAWGARWAGLEGPIQDAIALYRREHPQGVVIGVELAGPDPFGARNIDHHKYAGDDRTHPLSSLEQVATELGVTLSRRQSLIALNDRGYIPAMRAAGASNEEIREIRRLDRQCQGLTEEDERQAREDVQRAERRKKRVLVRCAKRATSAHTDLLFESGGEGEEALLASPVNWSYYGPRTARFHALALTEPHWSGGALDSGYFGVSHPSQSSQEKILQLFWE